MNEKFATSLSRITSEIGLATMEAPAKIKQGAAKLVLGLPKETSFQENRIGLTPEAVSLLVSRGHEVIVERGAGEGSHFYDIDYTNAGAEVVSSLEDVYKARIIIQVTPPRPDQIKLMFPGQLILSPIHLPTMEKSYLKSMMSHKITALAFEYVKDDSNTYPMVRSMSEIAGATCIHIAAEYLSNVNKGKGLLLGGITGVPPTKVVILGAGVVGEYASRTALGLGAEVKVFDNSIYKLMRLQNNIGRKIYTSIIQPDTLMQELETADVAIGAIHAEDGRAPIIVTEHMVSKMKAGAIIIDVSIDQGGCFETSEVTTHDDPIFKKYDVIHYCVPNIASRVSRTASYALSNIITPTLLKGSDVGGLEKLLWLDSGVRHGIYIYNGNLTNEHLSEKFNLKCTDLELLFAANF